MHKIKWILFGILLFIIGACEKNDNATNRNCEPPQIYFAGSENPFLCHGDEASIGIELSNPSLADVSFVIGASDGKLRQNEQHAAQWVFSNDKKEGKTTFRAYAHNQCGWDSREFFILSSSCTDSDTDTDTVPVPTHTTYEGPRHVILMIGDGMGVNCEVGLSRYLTGEDKQLSFHSFPYANNVTTWDINTYNLHAFSRDQSLFDINSFNPIMGYDPELGGELPKIMTEEAQTYFTQLKLNWPDSPISSAAMLPVTDSAAAATALSTGIKTDQRNVAWLAGDPLDGEIPIITEVIKQHRDMGIGVVSTVPFSHATPAAFVAHATDRNNTNQLAKDILHSDLVDVAIGAGHPTYYGDFTYISQEDLEYVQSAEQWQYVERVDGEDGTANLLSAADAAVASQKRLFGMFGTKSFKYPIPSDTPGSPSFERPSLEDPTLAGATQAALTVLKEKPDGFFLMVEGGAIDLANHQHDYHRMIGNMHDFHQAVNAAVAWVDNEGDDVTWDNTLLIVTSDHANGYIIFDSNHPLGAGDLPLVEFNDSSNRIYPEETIKYGLKGHTNELVSIYAKGGHIFGQTAALFSPYERVQYPQLPIIDNTHVFKVMMDFFETEQ